MAIDSRLSTFDCLLSLLRSAISAKDDALDVTPDWPTIMQQARMHGVEPLVYDVALRLPGNQAPSPQQAKYMKQLCLYQMNQQSLWLPRIQAAVAALRANGVEPVLLKGFGLAELYPKPYLRSWGDADIWVGIKNYHPGCKALREAFPEAIHHDEEYEELKHYGIVFPDGNAIELHRVAMDFPTRREEQLWQQLEVPAMAAAISDKKCQLSIVNCQLSAPKEPFNLLFVFLHAWEHFCGSGMPLKQALDLALLVKRDYLPLPDEQKQQFDQYLLKHLRQFHVQHAWQLVAYLVNYVTGITLPLYHEPRGSELKRCMLFTERVLSEGQGRVQERSLGGADRYDERERVKQMPVWRRKILTVTQRFAHARFLRPFDPVYARHVLIANLCKGLRRTIRRERMIDY